MFFLFPHPKLAAMTFPGLPHLRKLLLTLREETSACAQEMGTCSVASLPAHFGMLQGKHWQSLWLQNEGSSSSVLSAENTEQVVLLPTDFSLQLRQALSLKRRAASSSTKEN